MAEPPLIGDHSQLSLPTQLISRRLREQCVRVPRQCLVELVRVVLERFVVEWIVVEQLELGLVISPSRRTTALGRE